MRSILAISQISSTFISINSDNFEAITFAVSLSTHEINVPQRTTEAPRSNIFDSNVIRLLFSCSVLAICPWIKHCK